MDVRYHFFLDYVIFEKIGLDKISVADNVASGMTKCLLSDRFWSLWHKLGIGITRLGDLGTTMK